MAATVVYKQQVNASDRKKFTISLWFKRSGLTGTSGNGQYLFESYLDTSNRIRVELNSNEELKIIQNQSGSSNFKLNTRMKFRDTSAWYHLVIAVDTTQSTASDRGKMYINGTRITSFTSTTDLPLDNTPAQGNSGYGVYVGGTGGIDSNFYDGLMSHYNFVDGTAYDPSYFGETDATTGEWKIKTSPSVTYGANGFFILKDGNSVTDQSGNSNNFAVSSGTLTNTLDCSANVFATLNPLSSLSTFSYGNTEAEFSSGDGYQTSTTTLGMTSGKYYCEAKVTVDGNYPGFGICETNSAHATQLNTANWLGSSGGSISWYVGTTSGNAIYDNGTGYTAPTSFSTNDIVGMALDLDTTQNTLKYYKNGVLVQTLQISTSENGWMFGVTHNTNQTPARSKFNFGNGYFRSTAVASAGTNASGNGIFEYDVPTGFTALSTKGLNL